MVTCPKCNKELNDGTKICDGCGAQIVETTEKKKLPKKVIMFGGIGVAVIAVLILVISLLSGGSGNNYAFYLKDREIFFTNLKKDSQARQLTSRLSDGLGSDYYDVGDMLSLCMYMSEDGKYIFFPDKGGSFNLYYKEVAKPNAEAIKIDSGIWAYAVNTSATLVTYVKDGNLYQYKIREDSKDKIASEVQYYSVSDDGKKICYINSENSIYLKNADKEKEKIASDVTKLMHVTKDLATVYYTKDGSLYKWAKSADKIKIVSEVDEVFRIYDSGEIYYSTTEHGLCFYNGTEEVVITDASVTDAVYASDASVVSYRIYDVFDYSSERYIAVKGKATVVEQEKEAANFKINSSGTVVYYIDDIPTGKDHGGLYRISIENGVVGKPEVYDSDVYEDDYEFVSDTKLTYFKDYKNDKGELYINKDRVDYDVRIDSVKVCSNFNKVFYFTDWYNSCGTLKVYNGKKAIKIADDVQSFSVASDGRVLYLCNYSFTYYKGELYEWSDGTTRKIDDDVVFILTIDNSKYKRFNTQYIPGVWNFD